MRGEKGPPLRNYDANKTYEELEKGFCIHEFAQACVNQLAAENGFLRKTSQPADWERWHLHRFNILSSVIHQYIYSIIWRLSLCKCVAPIMIFRASRGQVCWENGLLSSTLVKLVSRKAIAVTMHLLLTTVCLCCVYSVLFSWNHYYCIIYYNLELFHVYWVETIGHRKRHNLATE